ncbi:MAG TPA: hypothetical protein VNX46_09590 [Candidatus Acidoferrum sp.]|jgi:hypothetical protein|nr:hypothetical protein [Candidatus Acidoferrum sp.]
MEIHKPHCKAGGGTHWRELAHEKVSAKFNRGSGRSSGKGVFCLQKADCGRNPHQVLSPAPKNRYDARSTYNTDIAVLFSLCFPVFHVPGKCDNHEPLIPKKKYEQQQP